MDKTFIALIIVSAITVIALIASIQKMKGGFGPNNLKVYGITLVIGLSVIAALTDVSSEKLSPAYGILGAFAGYLFGLKGEG